MSQKKSNYIKKIPVIDEKTGKRLYIKKKKIDSKYIQIQDNEIVDTLIYRIVSINGYNYKLLREKKINALYLKNKIKRVYSKINDIKILTDIFNEINKIISQKKTIEELIDQNNVINDIEIDNTQINNNEIINNEIIYNENF